jgi:GxxExxY protein
MDIQKLTYAINGCAMDVHNKLKRGFLEYVYCRALAIELKRKQIAFEREVWLPIHYDNYKIAARRCDFLCENAVILEIKAKAELVKEDIVQAINTVERLNISDGLLINFGGESLQFRHIYNNKYIPNPDFQDITPEMVGETNNDLFESRQYLPRWLVEKMQRDRLKQRK